MTQWEVYLVIVSLVGFAIAVGTPIIKLNTSITRLIDRLNNLDEGMEELTARNSRSDHENHIHINLLRVALGEQIWRSGRDRMQRSLFCGGSCAGATGRIDMQAEIIVALITVGGSGIGAFTGALINSRLTNYRLKQLEEEVRTHNNFARRMPVVEEQIKVINHRIEDLEKRED